MSRPAAPQPYTSPYLAGVGIGVVLLLTYVVMGRGLGASGAFSSVVTTATTATTGRALLRDWIVIEVLGITLGGLLSGWLAGRVAWGAVERGPRAGRAARLGYAIIGGVIMGVGAKLARGCTSGQALTGGALLSVGSWTFVVAAFAAAFAVAPLMRRQWR
jgi:uncharacterized protein